MSAPHTGLGALAPVSLAELTDRAGLLTRVDRKYVVPEAALAGLVTLTGPDARVLEIGGRREFRYESTYFDTPAWTAFAGTAHRRRRRFKVRLRCYAESGECFVEVKTRGPRGVTVKERLPVDPPVPASPDARLSPTARSFVADRLRGALVDGVDVDALVPVLHTSYARSTLLLPEQVRVTVDRDLRWSVPHGAGAQVEGLLVVESKTPSSAPSEVDRHLWSLGLRPLRLSKYGAGLALLDPALPDNRWSRVIRRHLSPASTPVTTEGALHG